MDWRNYIERIPGVVQGKPLFKGTRMSVQFVLEQLGYGAKPEELVVSYPWLKPEHIQAAMAYAAALVADDELVGVP